jgi:hypothetical protein
VNVVITIVLLAAIATWAFAVYNRLLRLRERVKDAWKRLEPQADDAALAADYNARVKTYNQALATFPANIVGTVAGLVRAREWRSSGPRTS